MENNKKSKTSKKLIILWFLMIIAIVILLFIKNNKEKQTVVQENPVLYTESENGIKTNISEKLLEDKVIDGLKICNIGLTYKENVSYLKADIENTNSEKAGDFRIRIKIVDKEEREIITVGGYIPAIEPGKKTSLDTAITTNIAGAYNFEVIKILE